LASDPPGETSFSRPYRAWLLTVLLLVNAINLADRQGIAIAAPAIKRDLQLTDAELGLLLGLGFAIFFSLLALPIARMAEHWNRVKIVSLSVALLGVSLAACGIAQNFWQLILYRIGVGSGDAGAGPPVASLIGDHYPAEKRASVNSIIWLGAPLGAVGGSVLGGIFAESIGWRYWFFALGAAAFVIGVVSLFTLREPARGMNDPVAAVGKPPSMLAVIRFLWAKRSFRQILIGAGLGAIGLNALGQFFGRYFASTFGLPLDEVGAILGAMVAIAMTSGLLLGGFGIDRLGKTDRRWYVWGPAIALALSGPLMAAGVAQSALMASVLVLIAGHIALFVFWTPTLAIAMNMVGANMRASSTFVILLVLGLVGIGIGPTLAGYLSDWFAQTVFVGDYVAICPAGMAPKGSSAAVIRACGDASAAGVRYAIMAMSALFVWAALHYALAARHIRQDLDTHYST
jgi:predicted MFS family arabinose efflux permease